MRQIIQGKKAQVGKFLTGFISFLIIVVLIGVFIALSSVLAKTKGIGKSDDSSTLHLGTSNSLLLMPIEIQITDKVNGKSETRGEKMLVADALVYYEMGKTDQVHLQDALKTIINEQGFCLGINEDVNKDNVNAETGKVNLVNPGFKVAYINKSGKIELEGSVMKAFDNYNKAGLVNKAHIGFLSNGVKKDLYAESYYGSCLTEAQNVK